MRLTTRVHDRDAAGMTYVYPVVSRRAQGVSLGINLNPNNACNWRCIYCQVPGLTFGKGPSIDLALLREELVTMLTALVRGDYMERHVPADMRRLRDVAFSGNGEPTSSPDFQGAIDVVLEVLHEFGLRGELPIVVITNGSLVHLAPVREGLARLAEHGGRVWFKVDAGTDEGVRRMNDARTGVERAEANLRLAASLCPTWVQTMVLEHRGAPPAEEECGAYLALLERVLASGAELQGVLLYGLARPSHQPERSEIAPLPAAWMEACAERIRRTGLDVALSL